MDRTQLASFLPILAVLGFWGYCVYDFSRTDERDMQLYSRQVWILWLTLGNLLGALLWYFQGRPGSQRR